MKLQVVQIGNSRGIRIPQSILKQCGIEDEVDLQISENNLIIKPISKRTYDMTFDNIALMDNMEIQVMLRKIDITTLSISLVNCDDATKERIYSNLSEKVKNKVIELVNNFSEMDAKQLLIEMHRARISCSFSEI